MREENSIEARPELPRDRIRRRSRYAAVFAILTAAFCIIVVWNVNTGNVQISVGQILKILFGGAEEGVESNIIWKIRLPRIFMAAILGGALSLSGFLLQTFFGNPIAGPDVYKRQAKDQLPLTYEGLVYYAWKIQDSKSALYVVRREKTDRISPLVEVSLKSGEHHWSVEWKNHCFTCRIDGCLLYTSTFKKYRRTELGYSLPESKIQERKR